MLQSAVFAWGVPSWEGVIHTGKPNGWIEGTGLTVRDYFVIDGSEGDAKERIDVVRNVAREKGWERLEAQSVLGAFALEVRADERVRALRADALIEYVRGFAPPEPQILRLPGILLTADLLEVTVKLPEGAVINVVAPPWYAILEMIERDPDSIYQIGWRQWEEIIAASYKRSGFDEVILTPRSGDHGSDIIATKRGHYTVRVVDQVKRYSPGRSVDNETVSALLFRVLMGGPTTRGVVTTTATFAPRLLDDKQIAQFVPDRLYLRGRDQLLSDLAALDHPLKRRR